MSYARARLWLGIYSVGSFVIIAALALSRGIPQHLYADSNSFGFQDVMNLLVFSGCFLLWLLPLDFLGGYLLPKQYQRSSQRLGEWFRSYIVAAVGQACIFIFFGTMIMLASDQFGITGGVTIVGLGILLAFIIRNLTFIRYESQSDVSAIKLQSASRYLRTWRIDIPQTLVVNHVDIGFTGGIVGYGKKAKILIPQAWLSLSDEQLASAIARRALAIRNGSYTRGLWLAVCWNVGGFLICSFLTGVTPSTFAGLFSVICAFTLWTFMGLLVLPTLSRNASLKIDEDLLQHGLSSHLIFETAKLLDAMQDGEPDRPRFIETIFHPVPNVNSRLSEHPVTGFTAWNVARTTLFFSWPCLGLLSRSVHCNIGRPELWAMLPTD